MQHKKNSKTIPVLKNKSIYNVLTVGNLEDAFIGQNSQNVYFILYSQKTILCLNVISIHKEIITNYKNEKSRKSGVEEHSN